MQDFDTFDPEWDIVKIGDYVDEIWYIDDDTDYPRLGWEYEAPANNAPTMDSFNIDTESGANAGWDFDNDDAQMDWTTSDTDSDSVTVYITFNKGSTARLPTTADYDYHIQDDDATDKDCNWEGGTWSDYDGAVYVRIRAYDGTDYSSTTINDTLVNGIDGTNPTGTVDTYGTENPDSIEGDSADSTSGVASNDITIHDTTDDDYWTGSAWGASTWLDCTGTTTWSYDSSGVSWDSGHGVTVTLRIYDSAGNVDASADTELFTTATANTAPTVDYKTPINGTTDVAFSGGVTCYAYTNDTDGDTLNITWATNESGIWVNKYTNTSEAANGTESYNFTDFDTGNTKYWWKVYVNDSTVNISEIYHFTTVTSATIYDTTIRTTGEDYFVWLGANVSAYSINSTMTTDGCSFLEANEYIAIWNSTGSWESAWYVDDLWYQYHGANATGDNFTIHTFDIIKVVLTDSGDVTIDMISNTDINYATARNVSLINTTNVGANYVGWTDDASTTLNDIADTMITTLLDNGEYLILWNETNYDWDIFIVGFYEPAIAVHEDDVIFIKVEGQEYIEIGGK